MSNTALSQPPATVGLTLQVYVPHTDAQSARVYYTDLFGTPPAFVPHDDFFEWALAPGQECWFQVAARTDAVPLTNRVRFRVTDFTAAIAFLDHRGIAHTSPLQLPGVVAFLDFTDPWGNHLGYYQDILPVGQPTEYPGSSVSDVSQFTSFEKLGEL